MDSFWYGIIGAIVGGICSIIAVIVTQIFENRRLRKQILLNYKIEVFRDSRSEKKAIYIELINLLGEISKIEINALNGKINLDKYDTLIKDIVFFIDKNCGRIELFVPLHIFSLLMQFRRSLYTFFEKQAEANNINEKNTKKYFTEMCDNIKIPQIESRRIIKELKKDINEFSEGE